jgi:hypothetical protein
MTLITRIPSDANLKEHLIKKYKFNEKYTQPKDTKKKDSVKRLT